MYTFQVYRGLTNTERKQSDSQPLPGLPGCVRVCVCVCESTCVFMSVCSFKYFLFMFTTPYTDDEFDCHWHCSCVFSLFVLTEFCFFILGSDRLPEAAEQSEPKLRYRLLERCNHLSEEVSYLYFCSWRHLKLTLPVDGILLIPDSFLFFCI